MKTFFQVLVCLFVSGPLFAAELEVCDTCIFTDIQTAVDAAAPGDTITILDPVITESGIRVSKDFLRIRGLGKDQTIVQGHANMYNANKNVFSVGACIGFTLENMTIRHGSSIRSDIVSGGGIRLSSMESVRLENLRVIDNFAAGVGGGISISVVNGIDIINCDISGNTGNGGGGIAIDTSAIDIVDTTIDGNTSMGSGFDNGGGGFSSSNSFVDVSHSTISNNSAPYGGAIFHMGYTLDMDNSTLSGNTTNQAGAALENYTVATLSHLTVVNNNGQGLMNLGSNMSIGSSIVAGNSGGDCAGNINAGASLSSDETCDSFSIVNTDPLLGELADNGGPTLTHMPADDSPAVDNGSSCSGTDQRGESRNIGLSCDLGAVETALVLDPNAPRTGNDAYATTWDQPLQVDAPGILANDYDPNGFSLESHLNQGPASGSLSLSRDGSFSYTPVVGFSGDVSFVYNSWNGAQYTTAVVTITVTEGNHAPVANDDFFVATAGTRLIVDAPGVLANDTDVEGDALVTYLEEGPSVGILGFHQDGSFWYEAPAGFTGVVTFVYKTAEPEYWLFNDLAVVTITVQ